MANEFRRLQREMNKAHVVSSSMEKDQNVAKRHMKERPVKEPKVSKKVLAAQAAEKEAQERKVLEEQAALKDIKDNTAYSTKSVQEIAEELNDLANDPDVSPQDKKLNLKYYVKHLMVEMNHPALRKNGGYNAKKGEAIDFDRAYKVDPKDIYAFHDQIQAVLKQDSNSSKNLGLYKKETLITGVSPATELAAAKLRAEAFLAKKLHDEEMAEKEARILAEEKAQNLANAHAAEKAAAEEKAAKHAEISERLVAMGYLQKNENGAYAEANLSNDRVARGNREREMRKLMQEMNQPGLSINKRGELAVSSENLKKFEAEMVAAYTSKQEVSIASTTEAPAAQAEAVSASLFDEDAELLTGVSEYEAAQIEVENEIIGLKPVKPSVAGAEKSKEAVVVAMNSRVSKQPKSWIGKKLQKYAAAAIVMPLAFGIAALAMATSTTKADSNTLDKVNNKKSALPAKNIASIKSTATASFQEEVTKPAASVQVTQAPKTVKAVQREDILPARATEELKVLPMHNPINVSTAPIATPEILESKILNIRQNSNSITENTVKERHGLNKFIHNIGGLVGKIFHGNHNETETTVIVSNGIPTVQ